MFVQAQRCHPNPETDRLGTPGTHSPRSPKGTGEGGVREGSVKRSLVTGSCTLKVPHLREGMPSPFNHRKGVVMEEEEA